MAIRRCRSYYVVLLGILSFAAGCGNYPEPLNNAGDIQRASSSIEMAAIADLPITDYPLLVKFQSLRRIQFFKQRGSGADDAKLSALSSLRFFSHACMRKKQVEMFTARAGSPVNRK